eukprot:7322930-Prymnesium_polylepis.1
MLRFILCPSPTTQQALPSLSDIVVDPEAAPKEESAPAEPGDADALVQTDNAPNPFAPLHPAPEN